MSSNQIVPFGKYKGQPVEVLRNDPGYVDWMMGQDWVRERYATFHTLIINNFAEPSETPEHNRLQTRFLDDGFCRSLMRAVASDWKPLGDPVSVAREVLTSRANVWERNVGYAGEYRRTKIQNKLESAERSLERATEEVARTRAREVPQVVTYRIEEYTKQVADYAASRDTTWARHSQQYLEAAQTEALQYANGTKHRRAQEELAKAQLTLEEAQLRLSEFNQGIETGVAEFTAAGAEFALVFEREFEVVGWDVLLRSWPALPQEKDKLSDYCHSTWVELKPALGDDYPATLRQMKANNVRERADEQVLVFDRFTAEGATVDQVRAIFAASRFKVLSIAEIERDA